jgi:hypothetical protein
MNGTSTSPTRRTASGISGLNLLAGVWLIISPFVLTLAAVPDVRWNNVAAGITIAVVAIIRMGASNQPGLSWVNAALGVWIIISPWVLGFAANATLMWNNVIIGALVALVALSSAFSGNAAAPERP